MSKDPKEAKRLHLIRRVKYCLLCLLGMALLAYVIIKSRSTFQCRYKRQIAFVKLHKCASATIQVKTILASKILHLKM